MSSFLIVLSSWQYTFKRLGGLRFLNGLIINFLNLVDQSNVLSFSLSLIPFMNEVERHYFALLKLAPSNL